MTVEILSKAFIILVLVCLTMGTLKCQLHVILVCICTQLSTQDTTVFFTQSATCFNSKALSCISLPAIIGH